MSWLTIPFWFLHGYKNYTQAGFQKAMKNFNSADLDRNLSGKICIVTGANSGIGKVTALELAKRKATVHIVCRNRERGEDAVRELKKIAGHENIFLHLVDMSKPKDVLFFANEFIKNNSRLYCLVNNAGCMLNERKTSSEFEYNFCTNTLGTFLLTETLLPLLSKSQEEEPRVVTVSSGGMLNAKLNGKDLNHEKMKKFDGALVYAQNKRQQVVLNEMWAKLYQSKGVHFFAMHPGWADTPSVKESMPYFYEKMQGKLRSAEEGADTVVWLSVASFSCKVYPGSQTLQELSGCFFEDRRVAETHLSFFAFTKHSEEEAEAFYQSLNSIQTTLLLNETKE